MGIVIVLCIAQFYAMLQLYKSGNNFGSVVLSDDPSHLVSGFKSYKNFWRLLGILMIVSIVMIIGIIIKLLPIIMEVAKHAR